MQQETFAGQGAVIWQYWLSQFGCAGDFNYSPQSGYQKFVPAPPSTVPVSTPPTGTPTLRHHDYPVRVRQKFAKELATKPTPQVAGKVFPTIPAEISDRVDGQVGRRDRGFRIAPIVALTHMHRDEALGEARLGRGKDPLLVIYHDIERCRPARKMSSRWSSLCTKINTLQSTAAASPLSVILMGW